MVVSSSTTAIDGVTSLPGLLELRVGREPEKRAFHFEGQAGGAASYYTYESLDRYARKIAARLQTHCRPGDRVMLLYPPGLDFIGAFFGCLYAGTVAVPVYPPGQARLTRKIERLRGILTDAEAKVVLGESRFVKAAETVFAAEMPELVFLDPASLDEQTGPYRTVDLNRDSHAFLQYTSGSTGVPKGVILSHGNLLHNSRRIFEGFGQSSESRCVIWLPPYHDMGLIGGILQPLYGGFPVWLMSPMDFMQKPLNWLKAISDHRATTSGGPNFAYDLCVQKITAEAKADLDLSSWTTAFCGAEPIRAETLARFAEHFAECGFKARALFPCYGLAEATLFVAGGDNTKPVNQLHLQQDALEQNQVKISPEAGRTLVSSGKSLPDQEVVIADPETHDRIPTDHIGEIWVKGPSVAQGYWRRPEQTRETFAARLSDGSGPYLRTGDLGFQHQGELYVTGRIKELIIIRGRNYHPQDIEACVEDCHPALRKPNGGAAFGIDHEDGEQLVVMHEVNRTKDLDGDGVITAIREAVYAAHQLVVHGVVLVPPRYIPKTTSGKTQRGLCRRRFQEGIPEAVKVSLLPTDGSLTDDGAGFPSFETEPLAWLTHLAARLLGVGRDHLSPDKPLGSLGLDSLRAMRLKNHVEAAAEISLPIGGLLDNPSLTDIAALIERGRLDQDESVRLDAFCLPPTASEAPLSFSQERLWFLLHLDPGCPVHILATGLRLGGRLDTVLLERALARLTADHEMLHAVFTTRAGQSLQSIQPVQVKGLPLLDLSGVPNRLDDVVKAAVWQPFSLTEGPLYRFRLIRLAADRHLLLSVMHHMITDGWSMGVLLRDLADHYTDLVMERELVPARTTEIRYGDYANWQAQWLKSEAAEKQRTYWHRQLEALPAGLDLPTDKPRPAVQTFSGARHEFVLPGSLGGRLKGLAGDRDATVFGVLTAAFSALLAHYSGQDEVVTGTLVANRNDSRLESLMGFFVNALPLRIDLSGNPAFLDLLARTHRTAVSAFANQDIPFEKLVEDLHQQRDLSRPPLFQVMLVLQDDPLSRLAFPGLTIADAHLFNDGAMLDLTMVLTPTGDGYHGSLEYNTDLFEAATMARLAVHYVRLLEQAAANPSIHISEMALLSPSEREAACIQWHEANAPRRLDRCFHILFEATAGSRADTAAAIHNGSELNYAELNSRATAWSAYLRGYGVGPNRIVGLYAERGLDFLTAVLAVFKAGGAYLPLDPNHPKARTMQVLSDSGCELVLTGAASLETGVGPRQIPMSALNEPVSQAPAQVDDLQLPAYVLYTSGSTGRPKGAVIQQLGMLNHLWGKIDALSMGETDVLAQTASQCFDISVWQFLAPLISGGRTVILDDGMVLDPVRLLAAGREHGITILEIVPSLLQSLVAETEGSRLDRLRWMIPTGEALPPDLARRWLALYPDAPLLNAYGPTECSDDVTHHVIDRPPNEPAMPIGRPLPNVELYVMNQWLEPVPMGIHGELHVGGISVGMGYHRDPIRTALAFVPDPFAGTGGGRLYRTGDKVVQRADGLLVFLGRMDFQVKLRGFRIELGEIEAALTDHVSVKEAVVLVREYSPGDKRLIAYVTSAQGETFDRDELRNYLETRLPGYMVPAVMVGLARLPLTPNGKIDRKALPKPEPAPDGKDDRVMPVTETQKALAAIWYEVLGVDAVGIHDRFFEVGGDSLKLVRVFRLVDARFPDAVTMVDLFRETTIAGLAVMIAGEETTDDEALEGFEF